MGFGVSSGSVLDALVAPVLEGPDLAPLRLPLPVVIVDRAGREFGEALVLVRVPVFGARSQVGLG